MTTPTAAAARNTGLGQQGGMMDHNVSAIALV